MLHQYNLRFPLLYMFKKTLEEKWSNIPVTESKNRLLSTFKWDYLCRNELAPYHL